MAVFAVKEGSGAEPGEFLWLREASQVNGRIGGGLKHSHTELKDDTQPKNNTEKKITSWE